MLKNGYMQPKYRSAFKSSTVLINLFLPVIQLWGYNEDTL